MCRLCASVDALPYIHVVYQLSGRMYNLKFCCANQELQHCLNVGYYVTSLGRETLE